MNMKIFCEICKEMTEYTIETFAKYHLKKVHGLTSAQYYNAVNKCDSGMCLVCYAPTYFRNIREGYNRYCSNKCAVSDPDQLAINDALSKEAQRKKYNGKLFFETEEGQKSAQKNAKRKYGSKSCFGNDIIKEKIKQTNIEKYGVDNPFKSRDIQKIALENKMQKYGNGCNYHQCEQTCIEKYGVDNYIKSPEFRKYMEDIGRWPPLESLTEYELYRKAVNKETRKNRKKVLEKWDGMCYYTNEKLITTDEWYKMNPGVHVSRNKLQPTIDHKIPIIYGFKNKIPAEQIGSIDNLCVCGRNFNTSKGHRITTQKE